MDPWMQGGGGLGGGGGVRDDAYPHSPHLLSSILQVRHNTLKSLLLYGLNNSAIKNPFLSAGLQTMACGGDDRGRWTDKILFVRLFAFFLFCTSFFVRLFFPFLSAEDTKSQPPLSSLIVLR